MPLRLHLPATSAVFSSHGGASDERCAIISHAPVDLVHDLVDVDSAFSRSLKETGLVFVLRDQMNQHHAGFLVAVASAINGLEQFPCSSHEFRSRGRRGWQRDADRWVILRVIFPESIGLKEDLEMGSEKSKAPDLLRGSRNMICLGFFQIC